MRGGGKLNLKRSRISNNGSGLYIGPEASKCSVFGCVFQENVSDGIYITSSKSVFIVRNNVFDNDGIGLFTCDSDVVISENNVFDNSLWGIFTEKNSRCKISMNRVFRNKTGGVRVGYRAAGKEFSPCVVEVNKIYDNIGPGLLEGGTRYDVEQPQCTVPRNSFLERPDNFQCANCQGNEIYNNKERISVSNLSISVLYCSNCRRKCEPKRCRKCFTAGYCNKTCQENHWSKHKKICKVLCEKSSLLITSMGWAGYDGQIRCTGEGLEEVGPNFSPPPPRDGRKFVVKVLQPVFVDDDLNPDAFLIYDRSLELYERFQCKVLTHLVQEFGVMCTSERFEKKLFLYCSFDENGQLRLFINEFPDFLNW